jgi:signal transduction histidine kinase
LPAPGDRPAIRVTNNRSGPPPAAASAAGSCYGLIGMRERAMSVGGRLRAGSRRRGGFEVITDLPLHPGRRLH